MKRHRLVQINVFFKKTRFTLSKSIYFHFKKQANQMLAFFQSREGNSPIWQEYFAM